VSSISYNHVLIKWKYYNYIDILEFTIASFAEKINFIPPRKYSPQGKVTSSYVFSRIFPSGLPHALYKSSRVAAA